jgi:probable F420-dependent oxidoreductase
VRFGLRLPHVGPAASADLIRAAAEIAEADGWDSVWTSDRVAVPADRPVELSFLDDYVRTYETFVTLSFVAAATTRLRLGTSAVVVPQRQVMLLARQAASLDAISEGRLVLGVAAGWAEPEFAAAGAGERFAVRGRVLDEAIEAMRTLWTRSPAAFHGRYVAFDAVEIGPRPAQPGGVPILVAGNSAAARQRAARLGDGWNPTALGAAETARGLAEIARLRLELGRDGSFACVGSLRFDDAAAGAGDVLQSYVDHGLTDMTMICAFRGADADSLPGWLRRFAREVLPRFG